MSHALRFRQWKTPKQAGERARLKVVHGPDSGSLFVVTKDKFTLGRGDENDVVLADLRASRRHAEVVRLPTGNWKLTDLGSQNGFVCNGKITREAEIRTGDIVTVGETAFEFVPENADLKLLHAPARVIPMDFIQGRAAPQAAGQKKAAQPSRALAPVKTAPAALAPASNVGAFTGLSGIAGIGASTGSASGSSDGNRKKIIYGILALVVGWVVLSDDPSAKKPAGKKDPKTAQKEKKDAERDLASYLPPSGAGASSNSAETFYQEGFREFREKNYLRARVQFETALQINPAHSLARSYLRESDLAIERDVELHLERGRRDLDAGKLKSARAHFEAVKRLLSRDIENPSFIEARDQLQTVLIKLKSGGDET